MLEANVYVIPFFEDDVDMEVARKQHDVYSQALGIIVSQCNLYAEFARRLLDDAADDQPAPNAGQENTAP